MFRTENHCKTPQVTDATDDTRHTRKGGLRALKRTLSLQPRPPGRVWLSLRNLKRTLKRTLSLRTLKRTLKKTLLLSTLKRTLSLRALKRTLSLRTLKRTLSVSTLNRTLSLRILKGPNQTSTPPCRLYGKR